MSKIARINKEKCPQNHICPAVRVCPVQALRQSGFSAPEITEKCIGCGKCAMMCGMGALYIKEDAE